MSGTNDPYTEAENGSTTTDDTYVYNGDGQRVKKVEGEITTKYYYTGSVILYTADEDNNKLTGNIPSPSGEIIASRDFNLGGNGADYYFLHYDIRGSVTSIIKPDGTLEQGYSYDEFGNKTVENSTSSFVNEMSYTGAVSDSTTGLSYHNARYYNPAIGAFTTQDTNYGNAYMPQTQHLYSYTGGNPVNYIDPTGHNAITDFARILIEYPDPTCVIIGIVCFVIGCVAGALGNNISDNFLQIIHRQRIPKGYRHRLHQSTEDISEVTAGGRYSHGCYSCLQCESCLMKIFIETVPNNV